MTRTSSARILLLGCLCVPGGCADRGGGGGPADQPVNANSAGPDDSSDADTNGSDDLPEHVGDPEAGAALFRDVRSGCSVCHGESGEGTALAEDSIRDSTVMTLEAALSQGSEHSGGVRPDFAAQDFADLTAFLAGPTEDATTNGSDADTNGAAPDDAGSSGSGG